VANTKYKEKLLSLGMKARRTFPEREHERSQKVSTMCMKEKRGSGGVSIFGKDIHWTKFEGNIAFAGGCHQDNKMPGKNGNIQANRGKIYVVSRASEKRAKCTNSRFFWSDAINYLFIERKKGAVKPGGVGLPKGNTIPLSTPQAGLIVGKLSVLFIKPKNYRGGGGASEPDRLELKGYAMGDGRDESNTTSIE